uniref:Replicase n=2 Tax=unclassified Sigmavirus TaxID=1802944 RepID=A0AAU7KZY9_9RHAB
MEFSSSIEDPGFEDLLSDRNDRFGIGIEDRFESLNLRERLMKHLSDADYSLNSPLIPDETDDFVRWMYTGSRRERWNKKKWDRMKETFGPYFNENSIRDSNSFAVWFGTFNQQETYQENILFNKILLRSLDCSKKTMPVVDAFLKGWIGENKSHFVNFLNMTNSSKKWGHLFWDLHCCTLMLNCTTKREQSFLESTFQTRHYRYTDEGTYLFKYNSTNFGEIIIGHGFCLFPKHNLFLDRNTILMMKDTYIARFNTLLTTANRIDSLYEPSIEIKVSQFYKLGDQILKEGGEYGYDALKLIEPMCNNKISQVAQAYRPLIPLFNDFHNHVHASVNSLAHVSPTILKLWKFIMGESNIETLLTYYGSFRHWGHPFINYLAGLQKLYNQVHLPKNIDTKYAEQLASDLALLVIRNQFKSKKSWPVDVSLLPSGHPLKFYISSNTWPANSIIKNFGPKWHLLPLTKCFEIPDVIDPSLIYSDKSHSLTRKELINQLRNHPNARVPSHKVLSSLLSQPATEWPKFLKRVNDEGISEDQLIIGLKAKERELKREGRFFALMSWEIRDYFVMTEYLIKMHFVPLFRGLTMADDLTTVVGKMIENTEGQGENSYEKITIANHIDYEKWNNHQRAEANNPVFKVMGQFLGYPNLIQRTHEIFQKSWVYYNERGDLMRINAEGVLENKTSQTVCWVGQDGGLEGLRQKGWSICNLLVLHRESNLVNTRVKVLAQGDNQVICTQYKLRRERNNQQLKENIDDILINNKVLFNRISEGTSKLGLIINQDETMRSTEFLNYGKNCVIRGNIRNLETKRWSRVNCVTNDQLPTLANVMSTTSSNALTVSHFSDSPINSMVLYNFLGHFVRVITEIHNPAIRGPISKVLNIDPIELVNLQYLIASLYLDPSLGGVSGMSLTRFLVRVFPDPITESLAFFKLTHDNLTDIAYRKILKSFGYPLITQVRNPDLSKLLEDPLSLNIPRGIDVVTMIKEEIKKSLYANLNKINNHVVSNAVRHQMLNEKQFLIHVSQIRPLFPRFLSEYRASTYFGIVDAIVGLFQNSRTIRNQFKEGLKVEYDAIMVKSELYSIRTLLGHFTRGRLDRGQPIWACSSSQADTLREQSWGTKVFGATVPHPAEMFGPPVSASRSCINCNDPFPRNLYVAVLIPKGFGRLKEERGTCSAYLGSNTLESTSILQTWEKETKIPLIRRADKLRNSIGWFVNPESNLSKSILNNLFALTGEDWSANIKGFKRTGSALHRFSCSRQSSGGYSAQNPSKLTRMLSTTNKLAELGSENFDFMYQNCLLNALMSVGEIHSMIQGQGNYHQHIKCASCIRVIHEIELDCPVEYKHPLVYAELSAWKPEGVGWSKSTPTLTLQEGDWSLVTPEDSSYHIGLIQGFIYADSTWGSASLSESSSLFPLVLENRVSPRSYCTGLLHGIIRSSIVSVMHQRRLKNIDQYHLHTLGLSNLTIGRISLHQGLLNIWRNTRFIRLFSSISHSIPPSYPMITTDISLLGSNYLRSELVNWGLSYLKSRREDTDRINWLFSDTCKLMWIVLLGISRRGLALFRMKDLDKQDKWELDELRKLSAIVRDPAKTDQINIAAFGRLIQNLRVTPSELRHAAKVKDNYPLDFVVPGLLWGKEFTGNCTAISVRYGPIKVLKTVNNLDKLRFQNPLIAGLRLAQLATGAHYKVREILTYLNINPRGALCAGDGSGGISALVLRMYQNCNVIFNSLCDYKDVHLRGGSPAPPSAITHTLNDPERCVNLFDSWANPNDLTKQSTWNYFLDLKNEHRLSIDLIVVDAEVVSLDEINKIENNLSLWAPRLGSEQCVVVFKTYLTRLFGYDNNILTNMGMHYARVEVLTTSTSSSQTSEVYVIMQHKLTTGPNYTSYPNMAHLYNDTQSFPLFSTPLQEFVRAQRLKQHNLLMGVPSQLLVASRVELSRLLGSLGVRADIAHRLAANADLETTEVPFALFILVIHAIFPFSIGYVADPPIPSDGHVIQLGVWISGFLIWMGYALESYKLTEIGQSLIDRYFPFHYFTLTLYEAYSMNFTLTQAGRYEKNLQLDAKMAAIGSTIRTLRRAFKNVKNGPDRNRIDSELYTYNPGITYSSFEGSTGLISLIRGETKLRNFDENVRISLLVSDQDSQMNTQATYQD